MAIISTLSFRNIIISAVTSICMVISVPAADAGQQLEFSSTMNPVGSGARATGMGGAFIGVADDATAASWNPAGLIQLEKPEFSIVGTRFDREQSYSSPSHPESTNSGTMSANGINFASIVYPFQALGRNMVASISYQRIYEMAKSVSFTATDISAQGTITQYQEFSQTGFMHALSPALAVQVTPALSLGVAINFWNDWLGKNGWQSDTYARGSGTYTWCDPVTGCNTYTQYLNQKNHDETEFNGINANLGVMWHATPSITLGGVVKTPYSAELKLKNQSYISWTLLEMLYVYENSVTTTGKATLEMPMSYGIGLQFRPSDRLSFALDASRIEWSQFVLRDDVGNETNPITTKAIAEGRLHSTTAVRIGTEYLFIGSKNTVPIRAGLFSDPEPNVGKVDKYYGFSLGTGYATPQYAVDASYQRRVGNNVAGDNRRYADGSANVTQETFMISAIFYF